MPVFGNYPIPDGCLLYRGSFRAAFLPRVHREQSHFSFLYSSGSAKIRWKCAGFCVAIFGDARFSSVLRGVF